MVAMTCPKCSYERKSSDQAPDWQCPSCGAAYAKFQRGSPVAVERDMRQSIGRQGRGDTTGKIAWWVYGTLLIALSIAASGFPPTAVQTCLAALVLSSVAFWIAAYRRKRVIQDVPTSKIAAASQGYVEIAGTVKAAPGHALKAKLTGTPCVWFHYTIERRDSGNNYRQLDSGSGVASFILRDRTGDCFVEAEQAEIVCDRCEEWHEGNRRYSEWSIRIGDPVHAIGHFQTGGETSERHFSMKAAYELGAEQKSDPAAYRERYDTNMDGRVDARESAAALVAKREELLPGHTNQGGTHTLGPSPDGRPFVVVSGREEHATSHYSWRTLIHVVVFVVSVGTLAVFVL